MLTAIPEAVNKGFSKRDTQILRSARRFAETQGLVWNDLSAERKLEIVEEASAEGRLGKMKSDERRIWREQAGALGWDHKTVMDEVAHPRRTDAERFDMAYAFAAKELAVEFHTGAVISHEKLGMYAARGLIGSGIAGGQDDIQSVVDLIEQRGIQLKGEHVALIVGMFDGQVRVTNTAQVRIEEKLAALAQGMGSDKSGALPAHAIRHAIEAAGIGFTEEQRAAIHAIGAAGALTLLTGVARTGMTIKMLGDREQAQAIEAGDTIEILRRALPPEAMPVLLTTMRQASQRGREIAGLFRKAEAEAALAMKREDGHAMMVGGDREQVVGRIADLYIERRDVLRASGSKRGISISTPTNDDAAEISLAVRQRLQMRGEIAAAEVVYKAIDQRGQTYDLALAAGDRVRLFRRTWGAVDGKKQEIGSNGDVVEVLGQSHDRLRVRVKDGRVADVEWRRVADAETGRLMLGFGHALTIDSAQGITSDEHINALPRGTSGVTGFTGYVAESRSRGTTWTVVAEGAVLEAERRRQALGDITPITEATLWKRVAEDMSQKSYKALGMDMLGDARWDRERAVDAFIDSHHGIEAAQLRNAGAGAKVVKHYQAQAVNEGLGRRLAGLDHALQENGTLLRETVQAREAADHLRALCAEATAAKQKIEAAAAARPRFPSPSPGPGM